jgi:hypothetical protein
MEAIKSRQSELLKGSGEIFMERLHGLILEVWKK